MNQRDTTKFTLWWTSGDRQACMWGGDFDTEAEAEAAIPAARAEYLAMCNDDSPVDEDHIWTIEPPEERYYMNPMTGSVDTYDGWWYFDESGDMERNAVDCGEVVEVRKDDNGDWVEV